MPSTPPRIAKLGFKDTPVLYLNLFSEIKKNFFCFALINRGKYGGIFKFNNKLIINIWVNKSPNIYINMVQKAPKSKQYQSGKTAKEYIMLTKIEMEFYEHSAGALIKLVDEVTKIRKAVEQCTGRPLPESEEPVKEEHPRDSQFDVLAVTAVKVFPFKDGANLGHMKGCAQVTLNDQLVINGLRIMDGENGLFVAYPLDPFYKGDDLRSVCFPITRQLKEHIENCVLEKYQYITK